MDLNTSASVISYISDFENKSAQLYEKWAQNYDDLKEIFLTFAKENRKNEKRIRRSYYNIVSDALETNFCFKGLKADIILPLSTSEISKSRLLQTCISFEKSIHSFYLESAKMSRNLLADVQRALDYAAKLRKSRLEKLQSFIS